MKLIKTVRMKLFLTMLALLNCTIFVLAQDNGTSNVTTTHTESTSWYVHPWVWIVGAAVFILILVALLRGRKSDNVTVTKTTTESTDI